MTIYRPGTYVSYPGFGVRVVQPGGGAAIPWYLSGGIAAANCLAAYTPKGAASLAASYDNNAAPGNGLADGTYDAAPGVAPTWAAGTGWTLNGTTQYLTTGGLVPTNNQSWSLIGRFANFTGTSWRSLVGCSWGSWVGLALQEFSDNLISYWNGSYRKSGTMWPAAGIVAVAGTQGYLNGAPDGAAIAAGAGVNTRQLFLGCMNNAGSAVSFFTGSIYAVAVYNAALSLAQVGAVTTAMAAL